MRSNHSCNSFKGTITGRPLYFIVSCNKTITMVSDGVSLFFRPGFYHHLDHVIPSELLSVLQGYGLSFSFWVGIGFALSYFFHPTCSNSIYSFCWSWLFSIRKNERIIQYLPKVGDADDDKPIILWIFPDKSEWVFLRKFYGISTMWCPRAMCVITPIH